MEAMLPIQNKLETRWARTRLELSLISLSPGRSQPSLWDAEGMGLQGNQAGIVRVRALCFSSSVVIPVVLPEPMESRRAWGHPRTSGPTPIPAWLNDLQEDAFSPFLPLSSVFLTLLEWELLHPKVLLPAGASPAQGKGSQRTTAPFSQQENTSGSIPSPQQGVSAVLPAAPPCSTPLPGLIRCFGRASFPFSLPAAPGAPKNTRLHPLPSSGAGFSPLLLGHFPRHGDPSSEWLCWNSSGIEELSQQPAGASSG